MNTLVLGSSGQLASHLKQLLPDADFWGRNDCDLNDLQAAREAVMRMRPAAMINAAAFTAVDRAEEQRSDAWRLNADAVAVLSETAEKLGIPFVHISTDYVFDGTHKSPYEVTDAPCPVSTYGKTKLAGELAATTLCSNHFVFRVSWLFSEFGANFVKTMLRLATERDSLSIVDDQRGVPTYAGDLARAVAATIARRDELRLPPGIYHVTGGRPVSWCQFAGEIFAKAKRLALIGRIPELIPIPTSEYPTAAQRPLNSVLKVSPEIASVLKVSFDWELSLEPMLKRL